MIHQTTWIVLLNCLGKLLCGKVKIIMHTVAIMYNCNNITHSGGYVPKDAPTPEVQGDSTFEIIIAATATSFGIISTTYFFIINLYYRNHP